MTTALIWHEKLMWHDTGNLFGPEGQHQWFEPYPHLESIDGKRRIKNLMDASGLSAALELKRPEPATDAAILRVHSERHFKHIETLSAQSRGGEATHNSTTTPVPPGGIELFKLASGAVITAVDEVLTGRAQQAYALIRPPGHHAETDRALGFCYFNNGAIAARHAQDKYNLKRIAFVDIDVHHGNGAEEIFRDDADILTLSIHQDRHFPPTTGGVVKPTDPDKNNLNIPLPPASGTAVYQSAFDNIILPALQRFQPELIMVPCGFDASGHDPLGRMLLSSADFRWMTAALKAAAAELCGGKLVMMHEGGYAPHLVPFLAHSVFEELSGSDIHVPDPFLKALTSPWSEIILPHQQQYLDDAMASVELISAGSA